MKIIITGGKGMLGRTLQKRLKSHDIIVADKDVLDITDCVSVDSFVKDCKPEAIIHCAAMTNVDACESNIDDAFRVNAIGSLNIASSCNKYHAKLIAVSTDYVFEGTKKEPYNEYDTPNPMTVYGKSKFAGEQAVRTHCPNHIIARISWLYGSGGPSFIHTMMKLADGSRVELKIVDDQWGNPTSTDAVAETIDKFLLNENLNGTFHVTCEGETSWYGLAKELFALKNINQKLIPCTTNEFPRPAPRPFNSRLDKMNLRLYGLPSMPHWKDALKEFLKTENF